MNVLMVIAHPNPASFNYALLDSVQRGLQSVGHTTRIRDLYKQPFPPVLEAQELAGLQEGRIAPAVKVEQDGISWADGLVFIYPLWWFDRPAILKGWCDRVFTHGFAFRYDEKGVQGLLPQRKAMVMVTAGGAKQEFEKMQVNPEQLLTSMTRGTLGYCGVEDVRGHLYFDVGGLSDEQRAEILAEAEMLGASLG